MRSASSAFRRTTDDGFAPACGHCGAERLVYPINVLIGFFRSHPLPGADFEGALRDLRAFHGGDGNVLASMCPGCLCITSDLSSEHTH